MYDSLMSQQEFWRNVFGADYIDRNRSTELLASNIVFFSRIFADSQIRPKTILELGANIGMNVRALRTILPNSTCSAVEINSTAVEELKNYCDDVHLSSIEDVNIDQTFELVFTKGVLIHISPTKIKSVLQKMSSLSNKWVLFAEYFSRDSVNIPYRGHSDVLFKRDFLADFIDSNLDSEWKLSNYGFSSRYDLFPQDDLNWYLLEKK